MPHNFSIFKQAVVNYDEIKNFIRQQVIKVFDGEDILFSESKDQLFLCKKWIFLSSFAYLVLKLDFVFLIAALKIS